MDIGLILVAVFAGLGIGILSGLLGIGGGVVMVPVFKLGFGMTAIGATATSLFAIIPTAISGGIAHVRQHTCIPKLGVLAGIGGACLSPVGVWLASISPGWAIMLAAAIVIGYSALTMFKKALGPVAPAGAAPASPASSAGPGEGGPSGAGSPSRETPSFSGEGESASGVPAPGRERGKAPAWEGRCLPGLPIGAAAGLVAGYVGVGGGFLMVPLFLSVLGVDMKRASGTSLLAIAILSIPGTVAQIVLGNVAVAIAIAVVAGSVPGAVLGARLVERVPERRLRLAFAVLLLAAAASLVAQEAGAF